jgi:hypothetical protein
MRFKFVNPHLDGLPIYGPNGTGVTYIWRAYPRQQPGYYTAFFWGNDDGQGTLDTFLWKSGVADSYYGAHPYPDWSRPGSHLWEISIEQLDIVNGTVVYDRWYTQALRVWADTNGQKRHEFYWDLPNTDPSHMVVHTAPSSWGNVNPPSPALTWGDAPWAPANEVWNGVLRGIQIYSGLLSVNEVLSEAMSPLSTSAGASKIWYLNMNPTPSDISDKSGRGHHPVWVGSERPMFYGAVGDYDGNGIVNDLDYDTWRAAFGSASLAADGNGDGRVDAADYVVWRKALAQSARFNTPGTNATAIVPEPGVLSCITWMLGALLLHRSVAAQGKKR